MHVNLYDFYGAFAVNFLTNYGDDPAELVRILRHSPRDMEWRQVYYGLILPETVATLALSLGIVSVNGIRIIDMLDEESESNIPGTT